MNEINQSNAYNYVGENFKEIQKNGCNFSINTSKKIYILANKFSNKVDENNNIEELEKENFIENDNKINSIFTNETIRFKSTVTQFRFNTHKSKYVLQPNLIVKTKFKFVTNNEDDNDNNMSSNIKGFSFICQKGNYVELNLNFKDIDTIVEAVSNLPEGLMFINGKIKGTPLKSGITIFSITTNKNEIIECSIEVPDLVRLL